MTQPTIAIDGPAGSGKSTVARRVAALLGYLYLDSGAMYRAVALKALNEKIPLDRHEQLEALTRETHIELKSPTPQQETEGLKNRVFLDGSEVTYEIRTGAVAQAASRLATIAGVRKVLVAEQQRAGQDGGVVMEGRDIGTVVFPHAELKIFLEAAPEAQPTVAGSNTKKKANTLLLTKFFRKFVNVINVTANVKFRRCSAPLMPCSSTIRQWELKRRRASLSSSRKNERKKPLSRTGKILTLLGTPARETGSGS